MPFFLLVLLILSGCNYGDRTYTEKYGYYSKYFPGFDWKEVGTCHRYHSTDRNGIACKQPDGSWKIKN